jgi:hypothetical protein
MQQPAGRIIDDDEQGAFGPRFSNHQCVRAVDPRHLAETSRRPRG